MPHQNRPRSLTVRRARDYSGPYRKSADPTLGESSAYWLALNRRFAKEQEPKVSTQGVGRKLSNIARRVQVFVAALFG